jgi:hypothetical protein
MSSTKIEPLDLREPPGELAFKMRQGSFQRIGIVLAMAMAMEALNAFGKFVREVVVQDTEP